MAVKEKTTEKVSKLKEILVREYRWENLLLLILTMVSTALALIIILNKGPISIDPDFPFIGRRSNQLILAWILFVVSMLGVGIITSPFVIPAIPELKKITWAKKNQFIDHSVRVIIFLLFFIFVIIAFDILVLKIIELISGGA